MSQLKVLNANLCPDGVPLVSLGSICEFNRGRWVKADQLIPGNVPVVTSSRVIGAYHNASNRQGTTVVVASSGAYAGFVSLWTVPIYLSNAFSVDVKDSQAVMPEYLYLVLRYKQDEIHALASTGGVPNVYGADLASIKVPVPPLEAQREIVRILDKFSALEAELEAELEARRRQFEVYRNLLISGASDSAPSVKLSEVLQYEQPTKYLVSSTDYNDAHPTPVLTAGKTFVLGHTDETSGIYPASTDNPVIIFDDFTTAFHWVDFPFKAKSSAMKMLKPRHGVSADFRYVYYAMSCVNFHPSQHTRHWISQYGEFEIPLPDMAVQLEIVRALDALVALVGDVSAGLPAEIVARKKQYEYYREQLLTFKELKS